MYNSRVSTTSSTTNSPSPKPTTLVARRKPGRRVGTGCITCKIRKIKCDETRPYCLRCLRTGRKCDGYLPIPSAVSSSSSSSAAAASSLSTSLSTSNPSSPPNPSALQPFPVFESQAEARAFDFYLQRSAAALSGDMDTELWSRMVIQLSINEPAVKHAALAISALHRRVDIPSSPTSSQHGGQLWKKSQSLCADEKFALAQYGKAMSALRTWKPAPGDRDKVTVPLVLCLLFVAVEFMRGDQESSQLHICQGRRMLAELTEGELPRHAADLLRRYLVPMYRRLGLACYLFAMVPAPIPAHLRTGRIMEGDETSRSGDVEFESMDQARDDFYDMLDEVLHFVNTAQYAAYRTSPPDQEAAADMDEEIPRLRAHQRDLLDRLERWNASFATLSVSLPAVALPTATMHLLRIYYHAAKTWIATALTPSELGFDDHIGSFSATVTSSAAIIDLLAEKKQKSRKVEGAGGAAAFSFETEVIAPLYWVCTKCRHPGLRRAALKLLQREEMRSRKENLWSVEETLAVSAYLITLEEGGQEVEDDGDDGEADENMTDAPSWDVDMAENSRGEDLSSLSPAETAVDGASMITASMPTEVESVIDKLLHVPTWYPPTIPSVPNLKLLRTLADPPLPSPHTYPPAADSLFNSGLPRPVQDSMKASYMFANTTTSPSSSGSPSAAGASTPRRRHKVKNHALDADRPAPSATAPSFGIPDSMRVKNIIVGPTTEGGIWVTTFRDPPEGKEEWDVKRKFIAF